MAKPAAELKMSMAWGSVFSGEGWLELAADLELPELGPDGTVKEEGFRVVVSRGFMPEGVVMDWDMPPAAATDVAEDVLVADAPLVLLLLLLAEVTPWWMVWEEGSW